MMKKIRILSLAMVCSMLFCTPIMAAEITTTEDAVIENNPEVVTESLESVKLEEMSPMSLSKEQYDVLSDDESKHMEQLQMIMKKMIHLLQHFHRARLKH